MEIRQMWSRNVTNVSGLKVTEQEVSPTTAVSSTPPTESHLTEMFSGSNRTTFHHFAGVDCKMFGGNKQRAVFFK